MTKNIPVASFGLLSVIALAAAPAGAQTAEVKEKPPLYTYVGSFALPRAKWAEMEKQSAATLKVFDKALSSGQIVGYGLDTALVHTQDGDTHDSFWSSLSLAGVLAVLDDLEKSAPSGGTALTSATKHDDSLLVSRYYNWKPASFKGAYSHVAAYTLKDTAPDNAIDVLSKGFGVPLFEKLLADGTILEYEIDQEQIHTSAPGRFWVVYFCKTADGLDKVNAALDSAFGANAFVGPALDSMVQPAAHRDFLVRTDGAFK
ncbi:MAG: hypothetical protein JSR66_00390 [Proteobacteria bacterium]|nr:hypothetical protein [Pseudomonadota bacterium]